MLGSPVSPVSELGVSEMGWGDAMLWYIEWLFLQYGTKSVFVLSIQPM